MWSVEAGGPAPWLKEKGGHRVDRALSLLDWGDRGACRAGVRPCELGPLASDRLLINPTQVSSPPAWNGTGLCGPGLSCRRCNNGTTCS